MIARLHGNNVLAGIISFGRPCKDAIADYSPKSEDLYDYEDTSESTTTPEPVKEKLMFGVYTRVSYFTKWIKANSDYTDCQLSKYKIT
jgi:hypothetical protein